MKAILLFPPNWSACVSGPHLALPLLAGMGRNSDWQIETWDLSEEFYCTFSSLPPRVVFLEACQEEKIDTLDRLYFAWEDQLRAISSYNCYGREFGLLSGFSFSRFKSLPLVEVESLVREGTVYTSFLKNHVLPRLLKARPSIIGITIASQEQIVPTLELLSLVREALPGTFLVLGGNIVTRLRETSAFAVLSSLTDQIILFQGDRVFSQVLRYVGESGVEGARRRLPKVVSDELIPYELWPVPSFKGIVFDGIVGTPVLSYVSTRGCYWGKCHFCAIPAGWSSKGYGGSAPADFVSNQLVQMVTETGIPRVKFVDEAFPPGKVRPLAKQLRCSGLSIEWEAYARLEPAWEDIALLEDARAGGLRKLYFGLEQAPSSTRDLLGKNDRGNVMRILRACDRVGIKVHLFCMVGYPGTSHQDAETTVRFLVENEHLVDTADLVGFRLDRGTSVPGVRPIPVDRSDWMMSMHYEPTRTGIPAPEEVVDLEALCQEALWESVPRLLHPLYRIVGHWETSGVSGADIACQMQGLRG